MSIAFATPPILAPLSRYQLDARSQRGLAMSADSPRRVSDREPHSRQLPGLRELLLPVPKSEASDTRLPAITAGTPTTTTAPFSLPTSYAPQPQWHPATSLPHLPHVNHSSQWAQTGPVFRTGPPLFNPASAQQQAQTAALASGRHYSIAHDSLIPPSMQLSQPLLEEARRDSALPPSSALATSAECIGQQHFPGRGLCYVYRDGATCPTVIDGEVVNPLWGTTKAGKARKRLAQACLNCREKKIRCEPRLPRCLQCEKSKKECIMPSTTQAPQPDGFMTFSNFSLPAITAAAAQPPFDPNPGRQQPLAKRRRSNEAPASPAWAPESAVPATVTPNDWAYGNPLAGSTSSQTDRNPLEESPQACARLLEAFFGQQINLLLFWYPKGTFWSWVQSKPRPRPHELMALYNMLALGAALLKDESPFAQDCLRQATVAVNARYGMLDVWLAQSRAILGYISLARGHSAHSLECAAGADFVVRHLRYYKESCCTGTIDSASESTFGMNKEQMHESRRRTFWAIHVHEAKSAVMLGRVCSLANECIAVKPPCCESDFERGLPSRATTLFMSVITSPAGYKVEPTTTSTETYLLGITSILKFVARFNESTIELESGEYLKQLDAFTGHVDEHLSTWYNEIPDAMRLNESTLERIMSAGNTTVAMTGSCMYHVVIIHAMRCVRHSILESRTIVRNVQRANYSASQLLQLADLLCKHAQNLPEGQSLSGVLSPLIAWPMFCAIDVLSAGGLLSDLRGVLGAIMGGCTLLEIVGYSWPPTRASCEAAQKRLCDLQSLLHNPERPPPGITIVDQVGWRCSEALSHREGNELDLIYGLDGNHYTRALQG